MQVKSHKIGFQVRYDPKYIFDLGNEEGEDTERLWSRFDIGSNIMLMRPETRRDYISSVTHVITRKAFYNLPIIIKDDLNNSHDRACIGIFLTGDLEFSYETTRADLVKCKNEILNRHKKEVMSDKMTHEMACADLAREVLYFNRYVRSAHHGTRFSRL